MPRYCAVKACRNRGGSASKQDNKRISFYPFPLQDKPRLQKWVENMKREPWTPSRHQCLCSEHFTEDCFDIRWGIRYLKHTAIPTIFPSTENDGETKMTIIKSGPKIKSRTTDTNMEPAGFNYPLSTRPLILSTTCKKSHSGTITAHDAEHTEVTFEMPLVSDTGLSCHPNLSEIQAAVCEVSSDREMPAASGAALCQCNETNSEESTESESNVSVFCCELTGPFSDGQANMDSAVLQAAMGQTFSFVPMEMFEDKPSDCVSEEGGHSEGEHVSFDEHSYCRPDTDEDQLWSKIMSLHAKILEMDRREESTVGKICALETEVALLKRDGAMLKEKQKVLGNYISSTML